jgi:hypothetical protein
MNIIDELVAHHEKLRELYRESKKNPEVFEEFVRHLVVHHTMEEKYFYDLLEPIAEAEHDALEAVNEHHIIELIIKDAEGFPRDHNHFPIKIEGLGEYTNHHLDEEEEEIFPMARRLLAAEDLDALGKLFAEARDKLLGVELPEVPAKISSRGAGPGRKQ